MDKESSHKNMINNQTVLRPSTYLIDAKKLYPQAWKMIDEYIQQYRTNWPGWCFLPANANVFGITPDEYDNEPLTLSLLPLLSAWRATQGIYRFDPDVLEPLWNTSIEGDIPTDLLFRLPEWCVYVETGKHDLALGRTMHGFFACLDFSLGELPERSEFIYILLDIDDDNGSSHLLPYLFPLKIGAGVSPTIEEMIAIFMDDKGNTFFPSDSIVFEHPIVRNTVQSELKNILPRIFSLLLYLCSENAEFRSTSGSAEPAKYPAPTKTKKGSRFFPPNQSAVWDTAWRIGASIRSFRNNTTTSNETGLDGGTKRPHIRRAHWHSFWIGSHDSERTIRIKWLPPIPVNVDSAENLIPVVRGVD